MRLILFVAAPLLVLAQASQNSTNSKLNADSKAIENSNKIVSPTTTVNNVDGNVIASSENIKSMSVIGASDDTIIVFIPTTASMTITEKTIEQQITTFTKVAETTFVSVSISIHATTLLPTIRRPMLQGSDTSNSGSLSWPTIPLLGFSITSLIILVLL